MDTPTYPTDLSDAESQRRHQSQSARPPTAAAPVWPRKRLRVKCL